MTSKIVNIRLDQETIDALEQICKWEKTDRSSVIRKLLEKAIDRSRLDYGIKLYQERKASIGKAAELANIDLWSFHDEIKRLGIIHPSDVTDLEHDLKIIRRLTSGK